MSRPLTPALEPATALSEQVSILSSLTELRDSWDQLGVGSGSPMHHYAWASACADLFATPSDLRVVVVGTAQQPAAIAPLVQRRRGFPRLELLGVAELSEPMDLVYRAPAAATALAETLAGLGLAVFLQRVPADSLTVSAMKQAWRGRGLVVCRPELGCPSLQLGPRWAEPEPPIAAGRRSDLRRARRRAEKSGPVSCQIASPTPTELDPLLADVLRVEAAGWKGRRGTALAGDPVRGGFYRRYATAACRTGILRLCFLRVGERIAAVQFAIESDERFWLLKVGYDEAFARCSPGMLLIAETVRDAAKRGLRSYEFLGTQEPWIRVWTDQVRPCVAIRAYPAQRRGMTALAADIVEAGVRKIARLLGSAP